MSDVTEEDVLNALNDRMNGGYKLVKRTFDFTLLDSNQQSVWSYGWETYDMLFFGESREDKTHFGSLFSTVSACLRSMENTLDLHQAWYKWATSNSWLASLSECTSLEEIMLRLSVIE